MNTRQFTILVVLSILVLGSVLVLISNLKNDSNKEPKSKGWDISGKIIVLVKKDFGIVPAKNAVIELRGHNIDSVLITNDSGIAVFNQPLSPDPYLIRASFSTSLKQIVLNTGPVTVGDTIRQSFDF